MFFYVLLDKYKFLGCIVMLINQEIKDIYVRYPPVVFVNSFKRSSLILLVSNHFLLY